MTDKPKSNSGNSIQRPNGPDQTRGQVPYSAPPRPQAPQPLSKPQK